MLLAGEHIIENFARSFYPRLVGTHVQDREVVVRRAESTMLALVLKNGGFGQSLLISPAKTTLRGA